MIILYLLFVGKQIFSWIICQSKICQRHCNDWSQRTNFRAATEQNRLINQNISRYRSSPDLRHNLQFHHLKRSLKVLLCYIRSLWRFGLRENLLKIDHDTIDDLLDMINRNNILRGTDGHSATALLFFFIPQDNLSGNITATALITGPTQYVHPVTSAVGLSLNTPDLSEGRSGLPLPPISLVNKQYQLITICPCFRLIVTTSHSETYQANHCI